MLEIGLAQVFTYKCKHSKQRYYDVMPKKHIVYFEGAQNTIKLCPRNIAVFGPQALLQDEKSASESFYG